MSGRLLSMSNAEIEHRIITNAELKRSFPFVQAAAAAHSALGSCKSCQKAEAKRKYTAAVDALRMNVRSLNDADRKKFKQVLGVDRVRFWYTVWENGIQKRKQVDF